MSTDCLKPIVSLVKDEPKTTVQTPPITPTALSTSAYALYTEIQTIHEELAALDSLVPGEKINSLLTRLVSLCIAPYSEDFTDYFFSINSAEDLCNKLRTLCAAAEGELEKYWVDKILSASESLDAPQTKDLVLQFPYHQNYIDLSQLEVSFLNAFLPRNTGETNMPLNIAFIGSGPLPLSSIHLLDHFPTANIHNIDHNAAALRQSCALTDRLGHSARMEFACEDAATEQETQISWRSSDVVFLAALVGTTSVEKTEILRGLAKKLKQGCLVVCRSARGLRRVLYPVLELSDDLGEMGLDVLAEVHPWTSVVNSVVVLRVR